MQSTETRGHDESWMKQAIELAQMGAGAVEPNPMVGCVIVKNERLIGRGHHAEFGRDHAEVVALNSCTQDPKNATVYVTLEPCAHYGKTPPCCDALIQAQVARVVIAEQDPFAEVNGQGISRLRAAGIDVGVGVLAEQAARLTAPFRKRLQSSRPWVIAKWAMTLDGKIATAAGESQWISNLQSRAVVHEIRGRVDAIIVGVGTAIHDDPLLNARPAGPRVATRVVVDSNLRLPLSSCLVATAAEIPTMLVASTDVSSDLVARFEAAGCEVLVLDGQTRNERLLALLDELGKRQMTNLLVEGGGQLLGSFLEVSEIDEIHVFIAPKVVGGAAALSPIEGVGLAKLTDCLKLDAMQHQVLGDDIYLSGHVHKPLLCHADSGDS